MVGEEGSRVEHKHYIESEILAKLIQSKCGAGGLKDQLVVMGEAGDLNKRGRYTFFI